MYTFLACLSFHYFYFIFIPNQASRHPLSLLLPMYHRLPTRHENDCAARRLWAVAGRIVMECPEPPEGPPPSPTPNSRRSGERVCGGGPTKGRPRTYDM